MTEANRSVLFVDYPKGMPGPETFCIAALPVPEPGEGEALLRTVCLSLDPYMRGRMSPRKSYVPPFEPGRPLEGYGVAEVVRSRDPSLVPGDVVVSARLAFQSFCAHPAKGLHKIDPAAFPLSYHLGVLGMPGHTAYVGLLDIGQPKEGETVFVSAAAGTVGALVGQIAKLRGCRVAGSAGSEEKVRHCLDELGFDACFDYKRAERLDKAVREACPEGIDVYFENVGGAMLDAVLKHVNVGARIPLCGMISQYNLDKPEPVYNLIALLTKRARIQGFIVTDHNDRRAAFLADMTAWLKDGKIRYRERVFEGLDSVPSAFASMLSGGHLGKTVVRVGADPS